MANQKNDSHDWLGDAAECLVRYCFSQADYGVFGSSMWGPDCFAIGLKPENRDCKFFIEVKSSNGGKWRHLHTLLKKSMNRRAKSKKMATRNIFPVPDILAGVLLSPAGMGLSIKFWALNEEGEPFVLHDSEDTDMCHVYSNKEDLKKWLKSLDRKVRNHN